MCSHVQDGTFKEEAMRDSAKYVANDKSLSLKPPRRTPLQQLCVLGPESTPHSIAAVKILRWATTPSVSPAFGWFAGQDIGIIPNPRSCMHARLNERLIM